MSSIDNNSTFDSSNQQLNLQKRRCNLEKPQRILCASKISRILYMRFKLHSISDAIGFICTEDEVLDYRVPFFNQS